MTVRCTFDTPNDDKVAPLPEALDLLYTGHHIDLSADDQKNLDCLKRKPNGRIPTIANTEPADGGAPLTVFESDAILLYLAEKTGKLLPTDLRGRSEVIQWLMFQMGGVGPMQGQANVFFRYWHERYQPAVDR